MISIEDDFESLFNDSMSSVDEKIESDEVVKICTESQSFLTNDYNGQDIEPVSVPLSCKECAARKKALQAENAKVKKPRVKKAVNLTLTTTKFKPAVKDFFTECLQNIKNAVRSYHTAEYKSVYSWVSQMSVEDIMYWNPIISKNLAGIPHAKYWQKVKIILNDESIIKTFIESLDHLVDEGLTSKAKEVGARIILDEIVNNFISFEPLVGKLQNENTFKNAHKENPEELHYVIGTLLRKLLKHSSEGMKLEKVFELCPTKPEEGCLSSGWTEIQDRGGLLYCSHEAFVFLNLMLDVVSQSYDGKCTENKKKTALERVLINKTITNKWKYFAEKSGISEKKSESLLNLVTSTLCNTLGNGERKKLCNHFKEEARNKTLKSRATTKVNNKLRLRKALAENINL